jgi:hypothetical protein
MSVAPAAFRVCMECHDACNIRSMAEQFKRLRIKSRNCCDI